MNVALSLNLSTGQVLSVTLSEPAHLRVLTAVAVADAKAVATARELSRRYHTGAKATSGLDYDDRLQVRLNCSINTAHAYLNTPVREGGLRHTRMGKNYLVSERAVQEFLGDLEPESQD